MTTPLPTDIPKIIAEPQAELRNLLITQRYHDLSACLHETIGADDDVNWSTFATWASKTAGQSIRNEEIPPFVRDVLANAEDDIVHRLGRIESVIHAIVPTTGFHASFLLAPIEDTLKRVSTSIAVGNLKVFQELAPLFAEFVAKFRGQAAADEKTLAAFVGALDQRPLSDGGQGALVSAFTAYFTAMRAGNAVMRSRIVLLGNCLIGLHEQTRLQEQIEQAMDAPVDEILTEHLHASLETAPTGFFDRLRDLVATPLHDLHDVVRDVWESIATRFLMSLALPGGQTLPLGRDIPPVAAARNYLPPSLQNITNPDDLVALLVKYDRARGTTDYGSASVDWRRLDDRMNFIVNLFRSRQTDDDLLGQPFNDAQRACFEAWQMPGPELGPL
ncbi:MAG TPA: hypothetical protein VF765_26350 [Polyangiaceae bacterium]